VSIALSADVVVIELPSQAGPEAASAVQSCEMVLGEGRCRAATTEDEPRGWYAVVSWQDEDRLRVRMELHRDGRDGPLSSTREMSFSAADPPEQRYRAVGLLVVSHVVAASNSAAATPQTVQAADGDAQLDSSLQSRFLSSWGVDVAGVFGEGIEASSPRWGGSLRGWFAVHSLHLRPWLSLGWATAHGAADATWLEGSVGAALYSAAWWTGGSWPVAFELGLEALAQRVELTAENATARERRVLPRYGVRVGLEAHVGLSESLALFVGGRVSALGPTYTLEVEDRVRGAERAPVWLGLAGVRVSR
jgi:hypothetical protein